MKRFVAMSLAVAALCLAPSALATHVSCGQRITSDMVLDSDLDCPAGSGIEIGASDVDLDLNGHTVRGETDSFRSSFGIWAYRNHPATYSGISVRNGTVIGFGTSIYLYGVRDSTVSGTDVQGEITIGGQPTNNLVEDNVVRRDPNQFPQGGIEVNESFYIGDETFRPAHNRVSNNTTTALRVYLADRNEVRGNHIVDGELGIIGSGRLPNFFEGNGADENVVADNRIESSQTFPGYSIILAQACQRNVVEGNEITGSQRRGIFVTAGCAANVIRGNSISDSTASGIQLGDPPYRTAGNVVEGNTVRDTAGDGILATSTADHSVVLGNVVSGNADDGIDVEDASATVTSTFAHDNGDWGIVAMPTVTDGGSNRAWSNGQSAQCLNVSCTPFPPSEQCRIKGKGTITAGNGDEATFDVQVHTVGPARPAGRLTYRDRGPTDRLTARSDRIDAVTCTADTASVFGIARVTGSRESVRFRVDLEESPDAFRIRLDDGYDSGTAPVSGGNIRIQ
jgi:parallel beta-helix repeat protein